MPRRQVWTVRVVNWKPEDERPRALVDSGYLNGLWVEQLRYMGHAKELADYDNRSVIEFYCPDPKSDGRIWANQNADRMKSFGIDAAAAPKWETADGSLGDAASAPVFRDRAERARWMERLNRRREAYGQAAAAAAPESEDK